MAITAKWRDYPLSIQTCFRCGETLPIIEFGPGHKECLACQDYYRMRESMRRRLKLLGSDGFAKEIVTRFQLRVEIAKEVLVEGMYHVPRKGRLSKAEKMAKAEQTVVCSDKQCPLCSGLGRVNPNLQKRKEVRSSEEAGGAHPVYGAEIRALEQEVQAGQFIPDDN